MDVKGKTIIVLVNDPPVAAIGNPNELDPKIFGGKAMTYYGRWTYKYEKAAELGAAGVLIVHETVPAGYPFTVVQGMGGERFDLVTPDKNIGPREDRGLDVARGRDGAAEDGRAGLPEAQGAGGDARVQAGAARRDGVGGRQAEDADGRLAERHREAHRAAIRRSRTSTSSTRRTGITSAWANP